MISFVGAGPGDFDLLTVKGQRRLMEAEVVIYDRLVNPLLLFHCQPECQLIYVGKTPYQASMKQPEINQTLVDAYQKKKRVVRLKGGDPAIFGRLTEELATVAAAGIPYEIIPGVTSASGAAAYSGFPLTERGVARSVSFITGHGQQNEAVNFPYAKVGQTLCLYMGIEALPRFIDHLSEQDFPVTTPIVLVEWATYGRQRKISGTLATILTQLDQTELRNPAMIIVGEVGAPSGRFDWFEALPRFGQRVLCIADRPPKISELTALTEQGADLWWHQVGAARDQRFDPISERYLQEHAFDELLFIDEKAKQIYQEMKEL